MSLRVVLRSPLGGEFTRGVVDGLWAEPPQTADTTLGGGLWALPGLADAHSHLAAARLDYQPGNLLEAMDRARESLRAGVTLVLDKGWTDDTTIQLLDALAETERPEIEAAARIIADVDGYFPGFALEVVPDGLVDVVVSEARRGRGWVKLIGDWPRRGRGPVANFDEAHLRLAVEAASAEGANVAIHTMAPEVPSMAVAAGVHSIEHGLFLTEEDLDPLGRRRGMWVPTVLRCEATLAQLGESSSGGKLFAEGLSRIARLLPLAMEAGVHVLAGTDLVGSPANVAAEAVRLGTYGLSNEQVVEAVSVSAFVATGRAESFEVGAPANAVFFRENPVEELAVLEHPVHVIRLGNLI